MIQFLHRSVQTGLFATALALQGCAQLPPQTDRTVSVALQDTGGTRLGRIVEPLARAHPGKSGVIALPQGMDAFAARSRLADVAERSLDVQYYIWHDDISGGLLLDALRRAADRGVRVRLLLDDNNTSELEPVLLELVEHRNIEVRLFNPFRVRGLRALDYLTDFARVNRRMHNKSFTADNQVTIVGGRNVGDEYFGVGEELQFVDLDVMAIGQVVHDVSRDFDRYWASESAYPADRVLQAQRGHPSVLHAAPVRAAPSTTTRAYLDALARQPFVKEMLAAQLSFEWAVVHMVSDDPSKGEGLASNDELLWPRLLRVLPPAKNELELVSPYFVPGDSGVEHFAALARRGVKVTILTNSLEATDVIAVHSGYAKRRKPLLEAGITLLEIKRNASTPASRGLTTGSTSASSLHAKTFSIDRLVLFVGSFNFDPRSEHLNTEMGFVIECAAMASTISDAIRGPLAARSYRVELGPEGALQWVERTDGKDLVWNDEPGAGFWRRLGVSLMSLLPIEWLL